MHVGEGMKLSSCDIYRCSQGRLIILFERTLAAPVGNFDDDNHGVFSQTQDSTETWWSGATAHCDDGYYSYSQHPEDTCSDHGGVVRFSP